MSGERMMAARLQLRVLRTLIDAIETLVRELWPLFRIYAGPWFVWVLVVLALDWTWNRHQGPGGTPDAVLALAFAPFAALISVGVLRWLMEPRDGFATFRPDWTWAWATALYAVIGLLSFGISRAGYAWISVNADAILAGTQAGSSLGQRLTWFTVGVLPNWLAMLVAYVLLMPQTAVIVERGAPSLQRQWQLMRLAPLSILGVAVLIGVCRFGLSYGYANLLLQVVDLDGPIANLSTGLPRDVAVGIWRAVLMLPAQFLGDGLALVVLARVYQALAGYADRTTEARPVPRDHLSGRE
ncbi:MAG: hypothetical protein R3D57_20575 [Hyphomicrobiaceae bacterium]